MAYLCRAAPEAQLSDYAPAGVLHSRCSGCASDYILAEQALLGIDGLLIELKLAERHRARLDELYRLVQNDERYVPEQFVAALRQLQTELQPELAA